MLHEFISLHRDELITRAREKVVRRMAPRATQEELENGVPLFLDQITATLRFAQAPPPEEGSDIGRHAVVRGKELLKRGFTVAQVVHDYGDVCQAVTELAVELKEPISAAEFQTFNGCLDEAIAQAVTGYEAQREKGISDQENQRLGFFAHELRNQLQTALL